VEIEAKFGVPDRASMQRLQELNRLGTFRLGQGQVREVRDVYQDTADRRILAAGYACRWRETAGQVVVTLKGMSPAQGAVHSREELETVLPADVQLDPAQWPPSLVRDRLLGWIGAHPLAPLFELQQTRTVRPVLRDDVCVAEMSLDAVRVTAAGKVQEYLELELELQPAGSADDLTAMVAVLTREWALPPEPRSKFERALEMLDGSGSGKLLLPQERAALQHIASQPGRYGRCARALLALDEGATRRQAGQRAPLSPSRVRHWHLEFQQRRLDVFPARVLAQIGIPEQAVGGVVTARRARRPRARARAEQTSAQKGESPKPVTDVTAAMPDAPGVLADDVMAEAARKVLHFHWQRMLSHEPGTRLGEDPEELHDMRVATRRMRAACAVFAPSLNDKATAPSVKGLKRTGRALGAVRDLDVFRLKLQAYLDALAATQQHDLDPLLAAWQARRTEAGEELLAHLDSERYARFKEQFGQLVETPERWNQAAAFAAEDTSPRVRWAAPALIFERLADVRACAEPLGSPDARLEQYHRLRIAGKRLRYALESFEETLGPEAGDLIEALKGLQDHLGDLQEAVVACGLLRDFLTWGTWGQPEGKERTVPSAPVIAPGVATYLAARQSELQQLVGSFPQAWTQFQSPDFSRKVQKALAPLW
jgi:CHAD domain-containing protein